MPDNKSKNTKKPTFRTWVNDNKVFFDIFGTIILGTLGLIISVNTCNLTYKDSERNRRKSTPQISVKPHYIIDSNAKTARNFSLEIWNEGERLTKFKTEYRTFLKITRFCARCSYHYLNQLEIANFYTDSFFTGDVKGKLLIMQEKENYSKIISLQNASPYTTPSKNHYDLQLLFLMKITCTDIFNEINVSYHLVDQLVGREIDEIEYNKVINATDSAGIYYLSSLTPDLIENLRTDKKTPSY